MVGYFCSDVCLVLKVSVVFMLQNLVFIRYNYAYWYFLCYLENFSVSLLLIFKLVYYFFELYKFLYILDVNHFWDMCFGSIFSHPQVTFSFLTISFEQISKSQRYRSNYVNIARLFIYIFLNCFLKGQYQVQNRHS